MDFKVSDCCFPNKRKKSCLFKEAVVVVREKESSNVLEVLNQFEGVTLQFSLVRIPDSEDWGTADSLRLLRGKLKVKPVSVLLSIIVVLLRCSTVMFWW